MVTPGKKLNRIRSAKTKAYTQPATSMVRPKALSPARMRSSAENPSGREPMRPSSPLFIGLGLTRSDTPDDKPDMLDMEVERDLSRNRLVMPLVT